MSEQPPRIGTWVRVHRTASAEYDDDGRRSIVATDLDPPLEGVVCGATYRASGRYRAESCRQRSPWDDYDPPYLAESGRTLVVQVRAGMTNAPVEALPEDVQPLLDQDRELPFRHVANPYAEEYGEVMREVMRDWPRDERGRWVAL